MENTISNSKYINLNKQINNIINNINDIEYNIENLNNKFDFK